VELIERLQKISKLKFSFGKSSEYHQKFSTRINACHMYQPGFGLGIPDSFSAKNQIEGIFTFVTGQNGIFVFNLNGVNTIKACTGFVDFDEAEGNEMITEWELSIILKNKNYLKNTIFHNGKVEFKQIKNGTGITLSWK
jgi:hypothetical protein